MQRYFFIQTKISIRISISSSIELSIRISIRRCLELLIKNLLSYNRKKSLTISDVHSDYVGG